MAISSASLAGQLAIGAGARPLAERGLEIAFDETAAGARDGRGADRDRGDDRRVGRPGVGRQQDLRPLQPAHGLTSATDKSREVAAFGFTQVDTIA